MPINADTGHLLQAFQNLPEHLKLAALAHVPFSNAMNDLPSSWRPLCLRAHHPSIDASHSLHLLHQHTPPDSIQTALDTAADIGGVRAISLAGMTLPHAPAACMTSMHAFPALTSLSLQDAGIRLPAAAALAAALPRLEHLRNLNLAHNLLAPPIMHELAPALQECTGLRSLNLWDTLDTLEVSELTSAVQVLSHLTAFRIGLFRHRYFRASGLAMDGCWDFLTHLCSLPSLVDVRLNLLDQHQLDAFSSHILRSLAHMSHLQHLYCVVRPEHREADLMPAGVFSRLCCLTSLRLDILAPEFGIHAFDRDETYLALSKSLVQGFSQMHALQQLVLTVPFDRRDRAPEPFATLASLLPGLPQLSELQILCGPTTEQVYMGVFPGEPRSQPILEVSQACLQVPTLRRLRVPVSGAPCRELGTLVSVLLELEREHSIDLSVDLFLKQLGAEDEVASFALCVPLFPYACSLDVTCISMHDDDSLLGLVPEHTLLTGLKELSIRAMGPMRPVHVSFACALLNSISSLTGLEKLQFLRLQGRCKWPDPDDQLHGMGQFVSGLRTLAHLSHLTLALDSGNTSAAFRAELLRAFAALPSLEELDLWGFQGWDVPVCDEVFQRLRLRVLCATIVQPLDDEQFESMLSCVKGQQHLRVLAVRGFQEYPRRLCEASADLPAFQLFSSL